MELKIAIVVLIVLVLIVTFVILLSGCTAQDNSGQQNGQGYENSSQAPPSAPGQYGNFNGTGQMAPSGQGRYGGFNRSRFGMGNFSNLTDAQRQQLMAQRMQQMQSACSGKAGGDACSLQGQNGGISGTCTSANGTLFCSAGGMRNRPGGAPPS